MVVHLRPSKGIRGQYISTPAKGYEVNAFQPQQRDTRSIHFNPSKGIRGLYISTPAKGYEVYTTRSIHFNLSKGIRGLYISTPAKGYEVNTTRSILLGLYILTQGWSGQYFRRWGHPCISANTTSPYTHVVTSKSVVFGFIWLIQYGPKSPHRSFEKCFSKNLSIPRLSIFSAKRGKMVVFGLLWTSRDRNSELSAFLNCY